MRTKHQLNLDPNPEGTQKILDDRRYGGRKEQLIPHVGGGAGAAQGVTGHLRALGDRTGSTVTNDGASVPEVLTPAKLESVLAVVVVPQSRVRAGRRRDGTSLSVTHRGGPGGRARL